MHLGTQRPAALRVKRTLLFLALLAASLTLIQCRLVGDRLTGVSADLFKRKDVCLADCHAEFQSRNQAEDTLHQQNLANCVGDPVCIANEMARHEAAERASKDERDRCFNSCHQQGTGNVGP